MASRRSLINLGFEWTVDGDDDRDAPVDAAYRERGEATWQADMPL
jgi:hypothetical protein